MSAEKTEEATPKRKQDERKKGNISKSQDLTSSTVLIIGAVLLFFCGAIILEELKNILHYSFTHLNPSTSINSDILAVFYPYAICLARILIPFMGLLMIFAGLIVRFQVGNIFALEKIKPTLKKLSPQSILSGFKKVFNIFDPKNIFELVKSIFKLIVVAAIGYSSVWDKKDQLFSLVGSPIDSGILVLGDVLFHMLLNMCIVMLIIGLIDKKYQDYQYNKSIKMSKQEVRDEYKNIEGDPTIKSKIKSAQINMRNQKMISAVPKADVVVTNPTHFAVAIKYDKNKAIAPIVVAKGVDFMAFKIREIAKNNNVPIVENKPLARSLYKLVDINQLIPPDLYTAVAEVLAWVYNKNKQKH